MIEKFIFMEDATVALPGVEKEIYSDDGTLTNPLNIDNIDSIAIQSTIDDTVRKGYIYIVPAEIGLIPNPDVINQYIWRYKIETQTLDRNTVYNRFFNNKLVTSVDLAFYFDGFEKTHSDLLFKIQTKTSFHEYRVNIDVPKRKIVFPISASYIFEDPYYIKPLSKRYDTNLVGIRTGVPDISAAILRNNSVSSEKYMDNSIIGRKIKPNTILSSHLNTESMKNFSLRNFKEDYSSSKLVYTDLNGNRTRFDVTDKVSWTIGGTGGVTGEVSIVSSTFEEYDVLYNGTTSVTNTINSVPRLNAMNQKYYVLVDSIKKDVKIESAKFAANTIEAKGLIITTHPKHANNDNTIDKTSAILSLKRNAGNVQINLDGFTNGNTPATASFITGILGGRAGNDYVDLIPCNWKADEKPEHGYCYAIEPKTNTAYKTKDYFDKNNWGICSLNYGVSAGDSSKSHLPWAVSGLVDVYYNGECSKNLIGEFVFYAPKGTVAIRYMEEEYFYPSLGQIKFILNKFDTNGNQLIRIRLF